MWKHLRKWLGLCDHKWEHTGNMHGEAQKIIGNARWQRSEGTMAIDIGNRQYSISNQHMSEQNRFRLPLPAETYRKLKET